MAHPPDRPELSVIVATRNETGELPHLFGNLSGQKEIALELIVSDGESNDNTVELARDLGRKAPFPVTVLSGKGNRGGQLNSGVAASRGAMILTLHADSILPDKLALRRALDLLYAAGNEPVAGHFRLRFRRTSMESSLAYYFYECKACLDRPGCTHGDQGLIFSRSLYEKAGPFPIELPMLAETMFADTLRSLGKWLLLPVEIHTSARRFEKEGLKERQTLNALICNAAALEWREFFDTLPGLYPYHHESSRLDLAPIFREIELLIRKMDIGDRRRFWYRTGSFVRANAWQLAFFLDVRKSFRQGVLPEEGTPSWLALYDRMFDRLIDNPPGRILAGFFTWCWFRVMLYRLRNKKSGA